MDTKGHRSHKIDPTNRYMGSWGEEAVGDIWSVKDVIGAQGRNRRDRDVGAQFCATTLNQTMV